MSLAQRVRDCRYSKGWGPDELASRAEISRTALYQIESGKTELPRAGTLRRIAVALDVPLENLLGSDGGVAATARNAPDQFADSRFSAGLEELGTAIGKSRTTATVGNFRALSMNGDDSLRFATESAPVARNNGHDSIYAREGELMSQLHDLLHSPIGPGVARIIDELHALLSRSRPSV